MRPRQACLGIRVLISYHTRQRLASMRPRQACLGIQRLARLRQAIASRFNEAEASLPRNTRRCRAPRRDRAWLASMRPRQACLGIPPAEHINRATGGVASMRPRQACLGIRVGLAGTVSTRLRDGFNEAEASLPRNTFRFIIDRDESIIASMRPRQACLGIL